MFKFYRIFFFKKKKKVMSMVDSSKIVVAQIKTSNLTSCEKIVSLKLLVIFINYSHNVVSLLLSRRKLNIEPYIYIYSFESYKLNLIV